MPVVKILTFLDLDEKSSFSFGHYLILVPNLKPEKKPGDF